MDIGIIGWWHQDNQGDLRIRDNMERALAPHRVVPIDSVFDMNKDALARLNLLDFVILGGGGLFQQEIHQPFNTFDRWGPQLRTPIGILGLGVDAVLPKYSAAVRTLADQAEFFYVRDRASRKVLEHPKVKVAADLTFLYPLRVGHTKITGDRSLPVCGVNLRKTSAIDVGQWISVLRQLPVRVRGIPFSTYESWNEVEALRQLDPDCASIFDHDLYRDLDLVVGTAFHSVVFAIQAGVPVIAIAYAPKVRRLMTEIGLEEYVLDPDEPAQLPDLIGRLLANHERIAEHLVQTTKQLEKSAQHAVNDALGTIKRVATPRVRTGPQVSLVVVGGESDKANAATLQSCLRQTYGDLEVIFVGDVARLPKEIDAEGAILKTVQGQASDGVAHCLNRAFSRSTGQYCSWIMAGDRYARDAIDCMLTRLSRDKECDMVYADCYSITDRARLVDIHPVDLAFRLIRRDVVGPCFLYRRELYDSVGPWRDDTPLVAYDFWLRAHKKRVLKPMHVVLFYRHVSNIHHSPRLERQARRLWRSTAAWPLRIIWGIVDSYWGERFLVGPLLFVFRRTRRLVNLARHRAAS